MSHGFSVLINKHVLISLPAGGGWYPLHVVYVVLLIIFSLYFSQLVPNHQSCGGVCGDSSQSYTATVINAAKVCLNFSQSSIKC